MNHSAVTSVVDICLPLGESARNLSERVLLDYEQGDFDLGQAHLGRLIQAHRSMGPQRQAM